MSVDGADESKALPGNGPDQLLLLAVVADRISGGVDAAVERRIGHDPAAPHQGDEIVSTDDVIAVFQQVDEQIKHLRLHRNQLAVATQLATIGVEDMIIKAEFHVRYRIFSQETINVASSNRQSLLVRGPASCKNRKL
jgi:hypothetical protein